jgi:hypothetical protein
MRLARMLTDGKVAQTYEVWWDRDQAGRWYSAAQHLLAMMRPGIVMGCWILRDVRKGSVDDQLTYRAQSFACGFCRKGLGAFKSGLSRTTQYEALADHQGHVQACAKEWFRRMIAGYFSETLPLEQLQEVQRFIAKCNKDQAPHRWYQWLDGQPQPPGSVMAHHVEIGLIATAQHFNFGGNHT